MSKVDSKRERIFTHPSFDKEVRRHWDNLILFFREQSFFSCKVEDYHQMEGNLSTRKVGITYKVRNFKFERNRFEISHI
jgi:hypothetical protein